MQAFFTLSRIANAMQQNEAETENMTEQKYYKETFRFTIFPFFPRSP